MSNRSRTVCMVTTLTRGDGKTETELEVEVFGIVDPGFNGSHWDPPSAGGVDNIRALFYDGRKQRDIRLTEEERKEFHDELWLKSSEEEPEYDDGPFYDDED